MIQLNSKRDTTVANWRVTIPSHRQRCAGAKFFPRCDMYEGRVSHGYYDLRLVEGRGLSPAVLSAQAGHRVNQSPTPRRVPYRLISDFFHAAGSLDRKMS